MYKILFADDEPHTIEGLNMLMDWKSVGIEIAGAAEDGEEAFEMIERLKPDIVLADIHMPNINGLELIKRCSEEMKKPPEFIILTGCGELEYVKKAMKYGARGYLLKPVNPEELNECIELVLSEISKKNAHESENDELIGYIARETFVRLLFGECTETIINRARLFLGMNAKEEEVALTLFALKQEASGEETEGVINEIKALEGVKEIGVFDAGFSFAAYISPEPSGFIESGYSKHILSNALVENIIVIPPKKLRELSKLMINIVRDRQQGFFMDKICVYDGDGDDFKDAAETGGVPEITALIRSGRLEEACTLLRVSSRCADPDRPARRTRGNITAIMFELYKYIQRIGMDCGEDFNICSYRISKAASGTEVCEICANLLMKMAERTKKEKSVSDFTNVMDYIDKNYKKDITLSDIGKALYIKPALISKIIKNSSGKKFSDYLNELRIKEACRIISGTDMKMSGVAREVGYKDYAYFANKFKQLTGVLPSRYRKQVRRCR